MILVARRSLVAKVARHQTPQIDIFFLNINVRRNYLVADSLKEVIFSFSLENKSGKSHQKSDPIPHYVLH